ncbi:putative gluconokinase [Iris pallida]|uniref:Gluconokinase n=1 Tax=Iris pallida TaxID=29817 RepID=A0AAX6H1G7_IRIPA|nr:putative gluconokinase [Iris pallida]
MTMASHQGLGIVIMGVSGCGKSTVAEKLSESLGCSFLEADDFHSQKNKAKMSKGVPLTDDDRTPWLEALRDAMRAKMGAGETVTVTCSALRKEYRDILRSADAGHRQGRAYADCKVRFACLEAPAEVLAGRISARSRDQKHFMPVSLLRSQLELLQIDEDEGIVMVDATKSIKDIIDAIVCSLLSD